MDHSYIHCVWQGYVNRSTSDVSDIRAEEERKRGVKERRQKPYNSDPFGKAHGGYTATGMYAIIGNQILITH